MKKIYTYKILSESLFYLLRAAKSHKMLFRIGVCMFFGAIISAEASAQYLHTDGTRILDENGEEVILRGIGLGGWMLQEGYMLKTSGPQHRLEAKFEALLGAEKKEEFYNAWLANHTRKIDIDSMAAWGYNSIRLPMHYKLFTPPIEEEPVPGEITWLEKGFAMTDSLLAWAEANDMYLILDLHAAPGGQGENADISDYDPSKLSLWESEANRKKTIALWRKLAERYADEPHIGAYDIINEPNWGFQNHEADPNGCAEAENTLLWSLQQEITEVIREVDQNHIIIIEGNCWGNNYRGLPELWDENLVISYHKYWNGNDVGAIQGMLNMRQQRNVPIWLGETGENSNTWFTDAITLLEEHGVGWSWWPLKKLGLNNPLEVKVNPGYQQILDYWNGNAEKPSVEDAYDAVMQLAENLKLENNIYHKDVVDAMIRQPHSGEALPFKEHTLSPGTANRIFATDFDLGRHNVAYHDDEVTNETGNAGGLAWNQGYSYRNDGVDIQPCEDEITNGYNVGWTAEGEWLQYTLNVDSGGVYQVDVRYAAQDEGSRIKIVVNGANQSGSVALPATGGYQTWDTFTINDVILHEGVQRVKFFIDKGGLNFNYLEFTLKKKTTELNFKPVSGETSETSAEIYLTLNKPTDASTLEASGFTCTVDGETVDITGIAIHPESQQKLIIQLEDELTDANAIAISYAGTLVKATDGTALEEFTDLDIKNNLPVHVALPAQIEAEDFAVNNGLQLEATTDAGGGQNVGYTNAGDYLDYLISVNKPGIYNLEIRIACNSQAGVLEFQQLTTGGKLLNSRQVDVPVTGGWQNWQSVETKMELDKGRGVLRVKIIQPEFNINWYRFTKAGVINGLDENAGGSLKIYPNPAGEYLKLELPGGEYSWDNALSIWQINGSMIYQDFQLPSQSFEKIELGALPAGLYVMVLNMNDKTWRHKFVVE